MTYSMTNVATAPSQSTDLLIALGDFPIPAPGGPGGTEAPAAEDDLNPYLQQLEQIGGLAGELEYAGLQTVCLLFHSYLESRWAQDDVLSDELREALKNWPELVLDYLTLPPGSGAVEAIIRHLRLPLWAPPLEDEDVAVFQELLQEEQPQTTEIPSDPPAGSPAVVSAEPERSGEDSDVVPISAPPPEESRGAIAFLTASPSEATLAADIPAPLSDKSAEAPATSAAQLEELPRAPAVPITPAEEPLDSAPEVALDLRLRAEEPSEAEIPSGEQPDDSGDRSPEPDLVPESRATEPPGASVCPAEQSYEVREEATVDAAEQPGVFLETSQVAVEQPDESTAAIVVAVAGSDVSPGAVVVSDEQRDESSEAIVPSAAQPEGLMEELTASTLDPVDQVDAQLPPEVAELVSMLLAELPLMDEALERLLQLEQVAEGSPDERTETAGIYADYLDRFAEAAETIGFSGLKRTVGHVHENLDVLAAQPRAFSTGESELLAAWSAHAAIYLNAPYSGEACQDLIDWLAAPEWPRPLTAEQARALKTLLQAPTLPDLEPEQETEVRPQHATPEDVSLTLPEDVNSELLDALLQELPIQSGTFSEAIQNLIAGGSQDDIKVAQRMAHTLKGAGNTVGIVGLANLTHHLEDILVALADKEAQPTQSLAMSLMNAADCLEAMGETLCGIGEPPDNAVAVLQEVLDWANRIDREGLPATDDEAPQAEQSAPEVAVEPAAPAAETPPPEQTQESQAATPAAKTQVAMGLVDELLRLGGESIILSGQVHEQARRIEERMRAMQEEFDRLQRLGNELERLIDIKDLSTDRRGREDMPDFDSLEMDQYSELHTTSRMLVEAATDASQIGGIVFDQLQQLDTMLITQEKLNRETQEKVFSARMVPTDTVVPRLQRSVRQTCRLTGKQADLHIRGGDTLMDGEVLAKLVDPLMHVLRNAVDHGIESAEQRAAAGKSERGNIWLDFVREGNNILVRCKDDGSGFDYPAIRSAAESRGLLEPGQQVSEDKLRKLLLTPNFSSRSAVTQTSGRGVGLDVVYSHALSHGGSLTLQSESGTGSTAELRLPVSLISTHALLVRVRSQVIAIADRGIERILHADDGEHRVLGGEVSLQVDERIYPLRELEEILRMRPERRAGQRAPMPVLLVRERSGVTAVPVKEVLSGTDLVVKEFGRFVPRLPGMIGATILGDGSVTPVLDLPELMSSARGQAAPMPAAAAVEAERETPRLPVALVVDDSLSARKALAQVMGDAGYEVLAARDGMEAAQLAQAKRPDIVLADMEMPRMNGIELTAHFRGRTETADLPVIMITSRSTAKHRRQAEAAGIDIFLTKPFSDDELLDHVAVLGRRG